MEGLLCGGGKEKKTNIHVLGKRKRVTQQAKKVSHVTDRRNQLLRLLGTCGESPAEICI